MTGTGSRILGIDYGSVRVGVAMSDPLGIISQGVGTWENNAHLVEKLRVLVEEEGVGLVVVGMPYAPDGGKGKKAQEVDVFIARLRSVIGVEVTSWDESFTSVRAHEAFIDSGMKKKKRREKHRVDVMAARLLLQDYLESHSHR